MTPALLEDKRSGDAKHERKQDDEHFRYMRSWGRRKHQFCLEIRRLDTLDVREKYGRVALHSGFELETGADSYFMVYGLKVSIQSMSKYIWNICSYEQILKMQQADNIIRETRAQPDSIEASG